ncbi:hypothetical protein BH10CYA1_BH10CYA1_64350 [soil metagenome]
MHQRFRRFDFLVQIMLVLVIAAPIQQVRAQSQSPSKVFTEYIQKRNANAIEQLDVYLAKSLRVKAPEPKRSLAGGKVENLKILAEKITGDRATVSVTGKLNDPIDTAMRAGSGALGAQPQTAEGTILMVLEEGSWKVEQESWLTQISAGTFKNAPVMTSVDATQKLGSYEWCWLAAKASFPQTAVAGTIAGRAFKPTKVSLEHGLRDRLLIRQGDMFDGTSIEIVLGDPLASQSNKSYIVGRNADSFRSPDINLSISSSNRPTDMRSFTANDHYGMRLQFGQQKGDLLPGYIVLRMPYKQSFLQGFFYAKLENIPHN